PTGAKSLHPSYPGANTGQRKGPGLRRWAKSTCRDDAVPRLSVDRRTSRTLRPWPKFECRFRAYRMARQYLHEISFAARRHGCDVLEENCATHAQHAGQESNPNATHGASGSQAPGKESFRYPFDKDADARAFAFRTLSRPWRRER